MPVSVPPQAALAEYLGPTTRHTRRVEIYESDGVTRWEKDTTPRLKGGSVTVDYGRDERRALDLTLTNDDGVLVNAPGEFWYDKIIKVFRGVRVNEPKRTPAILVIAEPSGADLAATAFRAAVVGIGFGNVQVTTAVDNAIQFVGYDILVNLNNDDPAVIALLKQAYAVGYRVLSMGFGNVATYGDLFKTPAPTAGTIEATARTAFAATGGHPVAKGWAPITYESFERINQASNPIASTTAWRSTRFFGTGGAGAYSFVTGASDGPIPEITTYRRKTWTTASTTIGDSGFEIAKTDGSATVNKFAVKPGELVTVSGWLRPSVTGKSGRARISFANAANSTLSTLNGGTTVLTAGQWNRISYTVRAPNGSAFFNVLLDITGTGTWAVGNTLDGTGLLIEFGSENAAYPIRATNRLTNPSFEVSATGWSAGGAGTGGVWGAHERLASGLGNTGYFARRTLTTIGTGAPYFHLSEYVDCTPGETIEGIIWVRSARITKCRVRFWFYPTDGGTATTVNGSDLTFTLNTWQEMTVTAVVPAGMYRVRISTYNLASEVANGDTLDVDQCYVGEPIPDTFDGTYAGAFWNGTAHASTSSLLTFTNPPVGSYFDGSASFFGTYWEGTANASRTIEGFKETSVLTTSVPASAGMTVIAADASNDAFISVFSTADLDRRWVMWHPTMPSDVLEQENIRGFLTSAINWLNPVVPLTEWEVQIGEFMIDRISEAHFPYEVKITGRDYTKKCMLSKFAYATQFSAGMAMESIIAAIAGAAGITKRSLPPTGVVVGRAFFFERGVSRWDAMKEIANAYNHEIYFDATGYLVLRPFNDPVTTSPSVFVQTGREGQLGSYEKSTSDARIFNHIMVIGESADTDFPNIYSELINDDPNSPTSVQYIGDRYFEYSSSFITSQAQADELAASFMAINALEEFELSFESLMLPWLEVGDIIGWIDPRPAPDDPNTFLLSSLTLPLGLAPMSGAAKRVTIVGGGA